MTCASFQKRHRRPNQVSAAFSDLSRAFGQIEQVDLADPSLAVGRITLTQRVVIRPVRLGPRSDDWLRPESGCPEPRTLVRARPEPPSLWRRRFRSLRRSKLCCRDCRENPMKGPPGLGTIRELRRGRSGRRGSSPIPLPRPAFPRPDPSPPDARPTAVRRSLPANRYVPDCAGTATSRTRPRSEAQFRTPALRARQEINAQSG